MAADPIDLSSGFVPKSQTNTSQGAPIDLSAGMVPKSQAASPQGFFSSAADSSGLSTLGHALLHPIDAVSSIPGAISSMVHNTTDSVRQGIADYQNSGLSDTTRRDFGRAVPLFGPVLAKAQEQHDAGNDAGMAGTLTGFVGGAVAPEAAVKGLRLLPGATRGLIAET
jgi:hypothetical protein